MRTDVLLRTSLAAIALSVIAEEKIYNSPFPVPENNRFVFSLTLPQKLYMAL